MKSLTSDEFVSLAVRCKYRIEGFVAPFFNCRSHCDDVVQNAFVTAWKKFDSFQYSDDSPDEEFVRWVCAIAKFEALAFRRAMNRTCQLSDKLIATLADIQIADQQEIGERLDAVAFCIDKLSEKNRIILQRKHKNDIRNVELAKEFGVGRQTISKWLKEIRRQLSRCVQLRLSSNGSA